MTALTTFVPTRPGCSRLTSVMLQDPVLSAWTVKDVYHFTPVLADVGLLASKTFIALQFTQVRSLLCDC